MKRKASPRRKTVRLAPGRRLEASSLSGGRGRGNGKGRVQLNESAAAILALCDGTRTREEIVAQMLRRASDDPGRALDVREFLDAASERGWIVER